MEERNYNKVERFDAKAIEELKHHYTEILRLLGEDPAREGLQKTPERVAKAMSFLTKGYDENPLEIIRSATFREEYKQMVLVKDIELYSLCEHHMLPFYGKAHVAYIPNGHITGLSKIARVVECFARRLQVQERLTVQIRDCIQEALNPMGVAVVIEASHMCMQMRVVEVRGMGISGFVGSLNILVFGLRMTDRCQHAFRGDVFTELHGTRQFGSGIPTFDAMCLFQQGNVFFRIRILDIFR